MAIGNNFGLKNAIKKIIIISIFFSTISCFIFCIYSDFIVEKCFHNKVGNNIVYLISIALPMIAISSSISGYFTAVRKVYKGILANILEYIAKIIITIILLNKYLPSGNIENICFALILGDVLSEVCSFSFNIFVFMFDINNNFLSSTVIIKNKFLYRILRILLPISFTSYIRSGLSTIKQLIIPSSLEKNGLNCTNALSEYRHNNRYGNANCFISI